MRKSSSPEQDFWHSLLLAYKNKPFHILQALQREVGDIILYDVSFIFVKLQ